MRFGPVPLDAAEGAILAHATRADGRALAKGRVLTASDCAALRRAGLSEVTAARFEPGDVPEDEAARRAAAACAGAGLVADPPGGGRVNLRAASAGILVVDAGAVTCLNRHDPSLTLATLRPWAHVGAGAVAATVKVIPFAAPDTALALWEAGRGDRAAALRLAPFRPRRAVLVQTTLPGLGETALARTADVTRRRLARFDTELAADLRCPHAPDALAEALRDALGRDAPGRDAPGRDALGRDALGRDALGRDAPGRDGSGQGVHGRGADLVLVAAASAIVDRRDVVPDAIERAGGAVLHLGAPLDPGNLLLLAAIGAVPVLGLPGCARSPRPNGIDLLLGRLLADLPLGPAEITAMGVGGLLADDPSRGDPGARRRPAMPAPSGRNDGIAAIVLAAGRSTRMGGPNKLLATLGGAALAERAASRGATAVERAVDAALGSRARPVLVVTGHDADAVRSRLAGRDVTIVHNDRHAEGMSTSLRAGVDAVPEGAAGAVVLLADMPDVSAALIDALAAAFDPADGRDIVAPVRDGRRGNPVLWGRRHFEALRGRTGDEGARAILDACPDAVTAVPVTGEAAFLDIDTADALRAYRASGS